MAKLASALGLFAIVSGSLLWIYFRQNPQKRLQKRRKNSLFTASPIESRVSAEESEDTLSTEHAEALTSFLEIESCDNHFKKRALITVANKAAFTKNHVVLRESGCLRALSCLVQSLELRFQAEEDFCSADLIEAVLTAVNNLANSEENQHHLQDCIRSLSVFASSRHSCLPEKVRVAALRSLVNFTCTDVCIDRFLQFDVQNLFDLTGAETSYELRIASLKLLSNLSWQKSMTSRLLSATIPLSFFSDLCSASDIVLRWLTFLRNITANTDVSKLTVEKTTLGRPMVAEIFCDISHRELLQRKLNELKTHTDDDIKNLALQLSVILSGSKFAE